MLSNRSSSQKEGDSLTVNIRGTCLVSSYAQTNQTATASHTGGIIRVNTDRSQADAVPLMVQVTGSVSAHDYVRESDTRAELTRSTSDIETGCTMSGRSVARVSVSLHCDQAETVSEVTSC